jgi:hypothetical protein
MGEAEAARRMPAMPVRGPALGESTAMALVAASSALHT